MDISQINKQIETTRSLKTRGQESKQLLNSLILSNNHELRSIVVNKSQIQGELSYFEGYIEIWSNWIIKCGKKLEVLIFLEKRLEDESTK